MSHSNNPVRDALLGHGPDPESLPAYRDSVTRLVSQYDVRVRREQVLATACWVFCALSAAVWIWSTEPATGAGRAPFLACIFMIIGGVEVLKHRINSVRAGLFAELKQLQIQLFELQQTIAQPAPGTEKGGKELRA